MIAREKMLRAFVTHTDESWGELLAAHDTAIAAGVQAERARLLRRMASLVGVVEAHDCCGRERMYMLDELRRMTEGDPP